MLVLFISVFLLCMSPFPAQATSLEPGAIVAPYNTLEFQFVPPLGTEGSSSFFWSFGDGSTSSLESPKHTYSYPGSYLATLTIDGGLPTETLVRAGYGAALQTFDGIWPDPNWPVLGAMKTSVEGRIVGAKGTWHDLTDPETTCTSPTSTPYGPGGGKEDSLRSWVLTVLVQIDEAPTAFNTWFEIMAIHDDNLDASIFGTKLQYQNGGYEISAYAKDNFFPSVTHQTPWQPVEADTLRVELQGWIDHPSHSQGGGVRLRVLDFHTNQELVNQAVHQINNDQLKMDGFRFGILGSGLGGPASGGVRLDEAQVLSDTCLPPPATDLVGHWDFDDPNQLGLDSSGNGRHGTVVGGATSVVGRPRTPLVSELALSLDGTGYVQIPTLGVNLSGEEEVTVAAWVQVASQGQSNIFRSQQPLGLYSDKFVVANYIEGTGWETLAANPAPPIGVWYHLAGVFNKGSLDLYVNGVFVGHRALNFSALQGATYLSWAIGARLPGALGPDQFFVGQVDDVKLYFRALSKTEIQAEAGFCP